MDHGGERLCYRVVGMDCASCAAKVETAIRRLSGVSDVFVSVPAETVTVIHDGTTASAAIASQIAALG